MTVTEETSPDVSPATKSGSLTVLDGSGDTKTLWDTGAPVEVEAAAKTFRRLKKKGYLAYKVDPADGTQGEVMTEFDPEAGAVIMTPPLAGG